MRTQEKQQRVIGEILKEIEDIRGARRDRAKGVLARAREAITGAMRSLGMSQLDLAVATGLSPTTVFKLLRGKNTRLTTLAEVADALGYELSIEFVPIQG